MESRAAHLKALGLLSATALLWSFGGVLIKSVPWNPLAIAGARSLIALPVLLAAARRSPLPRSRDEAWGAVAYALTVISFVSATKLTTAANAILLQYTAPVWVVLFGRALLGERVKRFDLVTIAVTFCGMGLFFMDRLSFSGAGGNALAILSGLAFALLAVFLRRQKDASPVSSVLLGNLLTAAIGLPFVGPPWPDFRGWMALALLGVFQIGLSYILYTAAIRRVPALEAILILFIEPVLNPVWVFLALGETPGPWALVGGTVVIGAVLVRSLLSLRAPAAG